MFSVESVSALGRRLDASIPQQSISPKASAKLKKIGRTAKIAGFRPGKVPARILEQHYGDQARREALGEALQESFGEAVQEQKLRVAGYPEFEIKTDNLKAEQIEYSATFEVYPEVALGDLSAQETERSVAELTDEDLEKTILTLRKQRASYEQVERAAQDEDQVVIDFVGKLDGEVFQGGEATDYPFTLGQGRMLADFENAVRGMTTGEEKSFDMTFPEDYHGKDVAGKQVTFSITLKKVEAPKLPEIDEEFAKAIGVADGDPTKLEAEIRDNLEREMKYRVLQLNKQAAMDALLNVAEFEVPKSLVDYEVQEMSQRAMRDMQSRGMKQQMTLPPELFKEPAEKRVKLGLLFADIVEKNELGAKKEQIEAMIAERAMSYEDPEEVKGWIYGDPNRLQEIESLVIEENVAEWVFAQAKVTEKHVAFSELMEKQ